MNEHALLPHQTTDIYNVTMKLCVHVREAKIAHAELRDQAERASVSTFLAVGEGLPHRSPRMRNQFFERARASACELASALHLACALGAMDRAQWATCHALVGRASAMLGALVR